MFKTPTQEEINSTMKRLGEIGWINGSVQIKSTGKLALTEKGSKGLEELSFVLAQTGSLSPGEFSVLTGLALKHLEDRLGGSL
jgi:hypothetical protein